MTIAELRERLSGRIHENDILEMLYYKQECPEIADALYGYMFDKDTKVASNALWVQTWDMIDRTLPYRDNLVILAITTHNTTIRRLALTLLERMDWSKSDIRTDFLDFCMERIMSQAEPPGVRALCIKLGYQQCRHYPELIDELKLLLDSLSDMPLTPAITSARKNVLKKLHL